MPDKLTDNEIKKALECCSDELHCCSVCPQYLKDSDNDYCREDINKSALDLINRLQAENEDLFYKLTGVMHSVDKWLDGDELKQDEVNRAATMREKTLQIVEYAQKAISLHNADIKRAKAEAYKEFAYRFKDKFNDLSTFNINVVFETVNNLLKELVGEDNV